MTNHNKMGTRTDYYATSKQLRQMKRIMARMDKKQLLTMKTYIEALIKLEITFEDSS